jgi:hypothetical protein
MPRTLTRIMGAVRAPLSVHATARAEMPPSAAIACEVLARRIAHKAPADKLVSIMSTRYKHMHSDGDIELSSALELAIDTHW